LSKILPLVNQPADIKDLTHEQLQQLAREIREYLIESVSKTGGHLASNLGVVELTLALHSVFNTPYDKIVWDVGHQAYVHKMLTGRKDKFDTLRQLNGISGFPKTSESEHDSFNTGHSSTSISAALGMARARDLNSEKNSVIAVIGDGALTGGMAFEALNDAGMSNTDLIVVLNDNEMSIDKNVGGLSSCLSRIRTQPIYFKVQRDIDLLLHKIPTFGKRVATTIKRAKGSIKYLMLPGMFFEELGFKYIGPIDGHNINELKRILNKAKGLKGPILIHALTQKGKGYSHAEEKPDVFHGISPFVIETGETKKNPHAKDYSAVFGEALVDIARENKKVVAITAAMPCGTGLSKFAECFPERFFDVGIAEQHGATMAAGLAIEGMKPVFAVYSSFLQRAYDQVIHDVCAQNLPVVFAIDRAGIVGNDGETHQGVFDLSYLSHVPNMSIVAPKDYDELRQMLKFCIDFDGPIAIRYPRGQAQELGLNKHQPIEYGKAEVLQQGNDLTLIACGKMVGTALKTARELIKQGISAEVINARFVKPLDEHTILSSAKKTNNVITIEDNMISGGFGNMVLQLISKSDLPDVKVTNLGYPDEFIQHGNTDELQKMYGLDAESITQKIIDMNKEAKRIRIVK
jgi:1-deoxy-D-xylulose-5-phosphate synthase